MQTALSNFNSRKFRFWSFISMVLLVFVHGYNLQQRYLQPWTIPGEPLTATSFTEYFLANGIFRFRIPMLFVISGYLYALQDTQPYKQRIRKRLRTLLLPYFIWSAIAILLTWMLETFPYTKQLIASSGIVQIDEQRALIHQYHWYEMVVRWIFFPVAYQLWFIRVLFIYNLAYPAIKWCITHKIAKWIFFIIAILMWLGTMGFVLFEGEGLLFFSLGVWIQKRNFDIDTPKRWLQPLAWGIIFILLSAVKTWLAFRGYQFMGDGVFPVLILTHKLVVLSGLIACWYGCNKLVDWCMRKKWFAWLCAFSFMIYALHTPLVAYAINGVFALFSGIHGYRMLCFVLLPTVIIILCIGFSALIRKIFPRIYAFLTGGRGM